MSQLLEEDAPAAARTAAFATAKATASKTADTASSSSQAQQQAAGSAAGAVGAGGPKAAKKKDKRKAGKTAKVPASTAAKKIPAWKVVSSDSDSGSDSKGRATAAHGAASLSVPPAASAPGSIASRVGLGGKLAGGGGMVRDDTPDSPWQHSAVCDSPSKGRLLAEQLLQARLQQQDRELSQLRQQQQQQQRQQASKQHDEVRQKQQPQ
ncbi:hypothetical protein COO60DRAFT_1493639, partial [Scenedesmus sp. NREL 46B-D3]